MSFDVAYAGTMKHEGGYAFDKHDKGGETYCGIARRWHPSWAGWKLVDAHKRDLSSLADVPGLAEMVKGFYRGEFWDKVKGDEVDGVSHGIANEMFDTAVNVDPKDATRFLQRSLNMLNEVNGKAIYNTLTVDGDLGAVTLAALKCCLRSASNAEELIINCMNGEQYIHYKNNPQHRRYRGWFARV